jgi:N-acetyl-gamma-glutamyl-phosphate reductase
MNEGMQGRSRVGVFGATGYTGRELVRLLERHPEVELGFTTGSGNGHMSHETALEHEASAYFLCLPHGVAAGFAARLRKAYGNALVIDLSGDLRLPDPEAYRAWYGQEHPAPALLGPRDLRSDRGLPWTPRRHPADLQSWLLRHLRAAAARAAAARRLDRPRRHRGRCQERRHRSGARPPEELLFAEVAEDLSAYSPGRSHRTSARSRPCFARHPMPLSC